MKFIEMNKYKNKMGIYKITTLHNGKIYIGKTEDRFIERYWNHYWHLKSGSHYNGYLQNVFNKYGDFDFEFSVIEECDYDIMEREIYYIDLYQCMSDGYNMTVGGDGVKGYVISKEMRMRTGEINRILNTGRKIPEETKLNMSNSAKGLIKSDEHRKHLSESLTGKIVSDVTRKKISDINAGSKSKFAILNEEKVYQIRLMLFQGIPTKEIAQKYCVGYSTIYSIKNNHTWKNVTL
jgi:group I intron endonuclease